MSETIEICRARAPTKLVSRLSCLVFGCEQRTALVIDVGGSHRKGLAIQPMSVRACRRHGLQLEEDMRAWARTQRGKSDEADSGGPLLVPGEGYRALLDAETLLHEHTKRELAKTLEALEWYGEKARAMARYLDGKKMEEAGEGALNRVLALCTELALDAGKRAEALTQREEA